MSTFAADVSKKDELTVGQRAEMRERAAQMKTQREQAPAQEKIEKQAHKAKHSAVRHSKSAKKTAKGETSKIRRHA
jgi:hypothetical protein